MTKYEYIHNRGHKKVYFTNKYLVINKKRYKLNFDEIKSVNQLIEHIKLFKNEKVELKEEEILLS